MLLGSFSRLMLSALFMGATIQARNAHAVPLPIEVIGAEGIIESVVLTAPRGAEARTLALFVHGVNRENKASIRINSAPWIALRNDNPDVEVQGPGKEYGGIGGGFQSLRLHIQVPPGLVTNGANTVSFRFNEDNDRSSGYRVLDINLLNLSGEQLVSESEFTQEDPTRWQPPRPDQSDIAEGRRLWRSARLKRDPNSGAINATCSDCHATAGHDLKYYNYSNRSIIERSKFHGLSQTEGEQIASYIRSLNFPNPGRPWNPPYQPGPGLDQKPISDWAAGAGLEYALSEDKAAAPYLPGGGTRKEDHMDENRFIYAYNRREIPLKLQFLDWNHWLPEEHPKDSLGVDRFSNHNAFKRYQQIIDGLEGRGGMSAEEYARSDLRGDIDAWKNSISGDDNREPIMFSELGGTSTSESYTRTYAAVLWQLTKMWEIMNRYGLQEMGEQLYGIQGEKRFWPSNRMVFNAGPHIIGNAADKDLRVLFDPSRSARHEWEYLTNVWYTMQTILNGGARNSVKGGHHDVDWKYNMYFNGTGTATTQSSQGTTAGGIESLSMSWKSIQELDTGFGPDGPGSERKDHNSWWGFSTRDGRPELARILTKWPGMSGDEMRRYIRPLYAVWIEKMSTFTRASWAKAHQDYNRDASYRWDTNPIDSYPEQIRDSIRFLRQDVGMDETLLSAYADLGNYLYPNNNWESLKSPKRASVAPVNNIRGEPRAGEILLQWAEVLGADSYTIKRAESPNEAYRVVALDVSGTRFRDPLLPAGKQYWYKVVPNKGGLPGEEGTVVGPFAADTGLVFNWSFDEQNGDYLVDSGSARSWGKLIGGARGEGKIGRGITFDGLRSFASSSQNLGQWMKGDVTVAAWIRTSANGNDDTNHAPAIMGSFDDPAESASVMIGSLSQSGTIGARFWDGAVVRSSTKINDGRWHHVAIARQGDGRIVVYIDGVKSGEGNSGSGERIARFFSVGRLDALRHYYGRDRNYWPGSLDSVQIYTKALTQSEVHGVMNDTTIAPGATRTPIATATPITTSTPLPTRVPTGAPVRTVTPIPVRTSPPTRIPTPKDTPALPLPSRAIDLAGPGGTIAGQRWDSGRHADVMIRGGVSETFKDMSLVPSQQGTAGSMLLSVITIRKRALVSIRRVMRGSYDVYLHTLDRGEQSNATVLLEDRKVGSLKTSGIAGSWKRIGPFRTSIRDGVLSLRVLGRAHIAGVEVKAASQQSRQR